MDRPLQKIRVKELRAKFEKDSDELWAAFKADLLTYAEYRSKIDPLTREFQAADLEERAQNAEDREDLGLASRLRAQARALRSVKP
jgi:hypothetical protein